ncbi:MAG TPA: hypothetical protein VGH43_00100 [Jatrophihabitans sp.]
MAAEPAVARGARNHPFALAVVAATVVPIVAVAITAPEAGARPAVALTWLLFIGSSMHVASTAWFYSVPEVRTHMARHRVRYAWTPLVLVIASMVLAVSLSARQLQWALLAFFAWQYFHFQKQNLGVAALTARARRASSLSRRERAGLIVTGVGGILGLVGHPGLLSLSAARQVDAVFYAGLVVFLAGAVLGIAAVAGRRDAVVVGSYVVSLVFFAPVWLFASPYAAVAGLTIAHGLQYLLLMSLVAAGGRDRSMALLLLVNIALLFGLALNQLSHLHDGATVQRALYGVFLGLSMSHFVVDAGLWRLRDEFPRTFLRDRLPYLLG